MKVREAAKKKWNIRIREEINIRLQNFKQNGYIKILRKKKNNTWKRLLPAEEER